MLWKKKKEELTPEEYRQQAQEEMRNLKNQWKTFFRTGIFLLAAVAAIIILGIAWFVSNNKVAGTGTSISASGSDFDLAADITGAASTIHLLKNPFFKSRHILFRRQLINLTMSLLYAHHT